LKQRATAALAKRQGQVRWVVQQLQAARRLDLCFLVDVTSSMVPYIQGVKNSIRAIVDTLLKKSGVEAGSTKSIVKKAKHF
jgi:hypothetical protein